MPIDTAVILCAGKGTRLYPITLGTSKALVPIANRPMITRITDDLASAGIRRTVLVVSPWDDQTAEFARRHAPADLRIDSVVQPRPLGLADAVACARDAVGDQPFVLYLGDELIDPGAAGFIEAFENSGADGSVLLAAVEEPQHFGVAEVQGDRILKLVEKPDPPPSNLAVVGVYVLPPEIFQAIESTPPSARGEVEITDAIQRLIDGGMNIRAELHKGVWFDVGRLEPLLAANRYCLQHETALSTGSLPPDCSVEGPADIAPDCTLINCTIRGPVSIGAGCRMTNATVGPFASIAPDCVIENSMVTDSILSRGCQVRGLSGGLEKSVLGEEVVIQANGCQEKISIVAAKKTCLELKAK